jgi:adenosylcobinamide-GDP ribazoletransferase
VSVERRLEIFRDPRHGTFALAGAVAIAALWLAALASIDARAYPVVLALVFAAARWGAVVHMLGAPHARPAEPSPAFAQRPSLVVLIAELAAIVAAAAFAVAPRAGAIVATVTCFAVATGAVAFGRRRLAGAVVGDVYGFAIVVAETAGLAAFALTPR